MRKHIEDIIGHKTDKGRRQLFLAPDFVRFVLLFVLFVAFGRCAVGRCGRLILMISISS